MASKRNLSEEKTLDIYRITLRNSKDSETIAKHMESVGYDQEKIAEGTSLLKETRKVWRRSRLLKIQLHSAFRAYSDTKKSLAESYSIHRKMARVAFRTDKEAAEALLLNAPVPKAYAIWLEQVRSFYNKAATSRKIKAKLQEFNLTSEMIAAEQEKIRVLEEARAAYLENKGLSQNATAEKDAIFDKLDVWMRDFYAMAKIAMRNDKKRMASFNKGAAITR